MDDKQELMEIVEEDRQHIINFFKVFGLKVKVNSINILFSDGMNEPPQFTQLWELTTEPDIVKLECTLIDIKPKQSGKLQGILDLLLDKISTRQWPDDPMNPIEYSEPITIDHLHERTINFSINKGRAKVVLQSKICYCQ